MVENMTSPLENTTNFQPTVLDGYESLNEQFDIGYGIISFIITPFVVFGNLLVFISLFKYKRLQTTTNMFIGSLAMSDFLLGLATLPMYALFYLDKNLNGKKYLCLIRYSTVILSMSSSLVNLVVIAVDRYIAILHPLQYPIWMTKSRAKVIITCVWVYHFIICSMPSIGWNNYDKFNGTVCDFFVVLPQPYTMFTTPFTIMVGLLISLYLYSHIYKVAKRHQRKMLERKERQNRQFTKDTRSARAMGIILFFFFIFWVPFMLAGPLKYLNIAKNLLNIIKNFALTLAMSNSAVNPFMYCWLRKEFKCAFQDLFRNYICSKVPQPDWSNSDNSIEEKEPSPGHDMCKELNQRNNEKKLYLDISSNLSTKQLDISSIQSQSTEQLKLSPNMSIEQLEFPSNMSIENLNISSNHSLSTDQLDLSSDASTEQKLDFA